MFISERYFSIVALLLVPVFGQELGNRCSLRESGKYGICKLGRNCRQVEEMAKKGITPTLCGFQNNNVPIVCCPSANKAPSNVDTETFVFPGNEESSPHTKRISEQKCVEYSTLVTGVVNAVPLIIDPEKVTIDVVKCDYNGVALIVGGSPASAGEFPFMAAVGYNDDNEIGFYCGGTLISDHFVVTAAHCANTKYYGKPVVVRLGDLDLKRDDDGSEYVDYGIADIIVHEQYRAPSRYNDIALLHLSKKVQFTQFIRPACLWIKPHFEHNKTVATGWGKTGTADDQSDKLQKVALNIYDNALCRKSYPPNGRLFANGILSNMMCAGELKGGSDTCQGDSGGPLIVTKKGNQCIFYVIGITSFGKGCGGPNLPAVYTRISEYVSWIEKKIW